MWIILLNGIFSELSGIYFQNIKLFRVLTQCMSAIIEFSSRKSTGCETLTIALRLTDTCGYSRGNGIVLEIDT